MTNYWYSILLENMLAFIIAHSWWYELPL